MPIANQQIGSTQPKSGTLAFQSHRIQGLPLKIGPNAGVTSVTNNRIVSIQQDSNGIMYAVIAAEQLASHTLIGWGVLEEALQAGGLSSIAPSPDTFVDGDIVTVLRYPMDVFMIDYDPLNVPTLGIGTAYVDEQGRLSSISGASDPNRRLLKGAVFSSVPGLQMAGQLKSGTYFYQMYSPVDP